jgi:hypothetical protein
MSAPRQRVELKNHDDWRLERAHVLGKLSLDEMAEGLPAQWQEYLASWDVDGMKVLMPMYTGSKIEAIKEPNLEEFHVDDEFSRPSWQGARLNSGYWMDLSITCWQPFHEKWLEAVCEPTYGFKMQTQNLDVAIITNINLFKMALKYKK